MFKGIDLYSDTVTKPTIEMRKAIVMAEVGDEQRAEDPTTRQLEEMMAGLLGFSAAIFLPSATMANEIAIRSLCDAGDELIAAENCHLFFAEAGGPAIYGGVMCKPVPTLTGIFSAEEVRQRYQWIKGPHFSTTKLVSVENTTNMGGGIPWEQEELRQIVNVADELGLKKHMDGARFFNASVKTGLTPSEIAAGFDMVTICLSKGLGCPLGAVLAFDKVYYDKVRRLKQLMGGAMRQSGMMAAAGIYALNHHITRLAEDHRNAEFLADRLQEVPQLRLLNYPPATNMVFFEWISNAMTPAEFNECCLQKGFRLSQVGPRKFRAVTHLDITRSDLEKVAALIAEIGTDAGIAGCKASTAISGNNN
ncbi:MAG TPA: threonine aldolase family protein [Gammaproteobacteria bacterium]|nr:threonine aldolase family protein [Gammaproteobacteria bacterium]